MKNKKMKTSKSEDQKNSHQSAVKKEKTFVAISGISSALSFLGGWQVCHNLCLVIIAVLSVLGISAVGMPLFFLTQYAVYFWSAAAIFLIPTLIMYSRHKECMSKNLIVFNIGIVIFSVPFIEALNLFFWSVGGAIILYSVFSFLKNRSGK